MNLNNRLLPAFVLLTALTIAGCSIGNSVSQASTSASDALSSVSTSLNSISRSLASSSDSSAPDAEEDDDAMYRAEVRNLTAVFFHTGGSAAEFERDLGALALEYGITDWEAQPATYVGIGSGLKQAGVPRDRLDSLLAGLPDRASALLVRGYQAH
ncbi:MAG: putative lipoprotein [Spirochaetales bacterium]|nr:putative lipoprotein [Leptospiraceae bacterium]MCP5483234.1 putative lipoprotein [Spirochaetales bacterium]MCP5486803.1 putative lipoprotein [Spirochaetales bacterium]